jgi:hypothetical protein
LIRSYTYSCAAALSPAFKRRHRKVCAMMTERSMRRLMYVSAAVRTTCRILIDERVNDRLFAG